MAAGRACGLGAAALLVTVSATVLVGQEYRDNLPIDHPAITYAATQPVDPVARLAAKLVDGSITLDAGDQPFALLRGLLAALDVPADSQTLVFSKTSFQQGLVSPRTPRAIYFNDEVALAVVPDSDLIELAGVDPAQGAIFYTLRSGRGGVRITRSAACLTCHQGPATLGVPGTYVSSVYTRPSGAPDFGLGSVVTDHRTPLDERWGGWYVTGRHGGQRHRGNAVSLDPSRPDRPDTTNALNLVSLIRKVDPSLHLGPSSDIVALMTLEHQTQMTNLMTRLGWEARIAEANGVAHEDRYVAARRAGIEELVRYMLFADEAALVSPIEGVSTFTATFAQRGPRDRRGRSLRDFDLRQRLFRYRLSYMVYAPVFDALPDAIRHDVYRRLHEILTGQEAQAGFARLPREERGIILEILRDTKPSLPVYWRTQGRAEPKQPVVKVPLHSTGAASRVAALLLGRILPVFSLVTPCHPGASPVSVRRGTFTTDC